jgi:hypothetical protein
MKCSSAVTTIVCAAFLCNVAPAGQLKPANVSPDANWGLHVDVSGLLSSDLGKHMIEQARISGKLDEHLAEITNTIGCNPLTDLDSVTLWGRSYQSDDAVIVAKGRFDSTKLLSLIDDHKLGTFEFKGRLVHHWVDESKNCTESYGVFWQDDVIVISNSRGALEAALTEFDANPNSITPPAFPGSFLVLVAKDIQSIDDAQAASLKNISSIFLRVGETQGNLFIKAIVTATSDTDGEEFRQMFTGMLALVKMSMRQSSEPQPGAENILAVLDAIKVSGEGSNIVAELELPVNDVLELADRLKEAVQLDARLNQ